MDPAQPDRPTGDGPMVRPFLDRLSPGGPLGAGTEDVSSGVRPYFMTRGRVTGADRRVRIETMVVARAVALADLTYERRQLVELARSAISVAEVAVAMAVPLGVARVLAADLADEGYLDLSDQTIAPRDDPELIQRLIDGVYAL